MNENDLQAKADKDYLKKVFSAMPEASRRLYCLQVANPRGEAKRFRCFMVTTVLDSEKQVLPYIEEITSRISRLSGYRLTCGFSCVSGNGLSPQDLSEALGDKIGLKVVAERL